MFDEPLTSRCSRKTLYDVAGSISISCRVMPEPSTIGVSTSAYSRPVAAVSAP